jgi:hypothetical protein
MTTTLRKYQYTFLIISSPFLLEMKNFWDKFVEEIKIHILCSVNIFRKSYRLYENMLKNTVVRGRPQMTIWRVHIACWINNFTITNRSCVIFLLFHSNNGCTNAPQCYVVRSLTVLFAYLCLTAELFSLNAEPVLS